jgi:hypothetical protein
VASNNDIFWVRQDVLHNTVSFYVKTWEQHASKHTSDKIPATEEHFYQAIVDPDYARRSLDPEIGYESCIFEKFFETEQQRFFVPVLYDEVKVAGDYDHGGKRGKVLTGYFPSGPNMSRFIGEIFWSKVKSDEEKDTK